MMCKNYFYHVIFEKCLCNTIFFKASCDIYICKYDFTWNRVLTAETEHTYIKLRDQEDINLTLSFMGGLFHTFIRGNDLNKTMHKDNTRHISLLSNTYVQSSIHKYLIVVKCALQLGIVFVHCFVKVITSDECVE